MTTHTTPVRWNIILVIYAEINNHTRVVTAGGTDEPQAERFETFTYLKALKREISSFPLSPNYKVFIVENIIKLDSENVVTDNVTTVRVQQSVGGNPKKKRLFRLATQPMANPLQKADTLAYIFKCISDFKGLPATEENWVADKNLLITWDHGSGFGIFKSDVRQLTKQKNQNFTIHDQFDFIIDNKFQIVLPETLIENDTERQSSAIQVIRNKSYKYNSVDFSNHHSIKNLSFIEDQQEPLSNIDDLIVILTNHELELAIKKGFGANGVDILLMFNCCMQSLHSNYALKDCVKVMIAPEGQISVPGYDYKAILVKINENPSIDIECLSKCVLSSMEAKFHRRGLGDLFQEHALFAIRLKNYHDLIIEPIKSLVEDLTAYVKNNLVNGGRVITSRDDCFEMTSPLYYYIIDIINWLPKLNILTNGAYKNKFVLEQFLANCNDAICEKRVGPPEMVYRGVNGSFDDDVSPQGYSIYFPEDKINYDEGDLTRRLFINSDAPHPDLLVKAINWLPFLEELFKGR